MKDNIKLGEIFYDNVLEHIRSAKIQANKNYIEANMIILDTGIAMTNHLFVYDNVIEPTIWGMKVEYHDNLANNYDVNFAISRGTNLITKEKKENKELKDEIKNLKRLLKNAKISRSHLKRYIRKLKGEKL